MGDFANELRNRLRKNGADLVTEAAVSSIADELDAMVAALAETAESAAGPRSVRSPYTKVVKDPSTGEVLLEPAAEPQKRWEDLAPEEQQASDLQRFGVLPGAYDGAPQVAQG